MNLSDKLKRLLDRLTNRLEAHAWADDGKSAQKIRAELEPLVAVIERLSKALEQVQCQCTLMERDSGHRIDCWNMHVPEALAFAEQELERVMK